MIQQYGKYKLKKIRGWEIHDNSEYTVICFYDSDTVLCESSRGELYVFLKKFLVDPKKPNEIYSDITVKKVNND